MEGQIVAGKRGGLAILADVFVAPRSAFTSLRERTHWGWAFLVTSGLGLLGGVLLVPAFGHVTATMLAQRTAADPNLAHATPEQQAQVLHMAIMMQNFVWLAYPLTVLAGVACATLVLLIGCTALRGQATFARLFGVAINVACINFGIAYLITGILAAAHGQDGFSSQRDIALLIPSLAWLAPSAPIKLTIALAALNPFTLWSFLLLAGGLRIVAGLKRVAAYALAGLVTFGSIIFSAPFAS